MRLVANVRIELSLEVVGSEVKSLEGRVEEVQGGDVAVKLRLPRAGVISGVLVERWVVDELKVLQIVDGERKGCKGGKAGMAAMLAR